MAKDTTQHERADAAEGRGWFTTPPPAARPSPARHFTFATTAAENDRPGDPADRARQLLANLLARHLGDCTSRDATGHQPTDDSADTAATPTPKELPGGFPGDRGTGRGATPDPNSGGAAASPSGSERAAKGGK